MKVKTDLYEIQRYKLITALQAKERLTEASENRNYSIITEDPQLLIAEQRLYRALDQYETQKAFEQTMAKRALAASRARYGKESVTKVAQDFFSSTSGIIMRMMQDIKIEISDHSIAKYLKSVHRKMLRQEIPKKIMKKLS